MNTCHQILQLCTKCNLVLPFDIMKFHKMSNCDNIEAVRLMNEDEKQREEEEKRRESRQR